MSFIVGNQPSMTGLEPGTRKPNYGGDEHRIKIVVSIFFSDSTLACATDILAHPDRLLCKLRHFLLEFLKLTWNSAIFSCIRMNTNPVGFKVARTQT